jgi:hypothetical protein
LLLDIYRSALDVCLMFACWLIGVELMLD